MLRGINRHRHARKFTDLKQPVAVEINPCLQCARRTGVVENGNRRRVARLPDGDVVHRRNAVLIVGRENVIPRGKRAVLRRGLGIHSRTDADGIRKSLARLGAIIIGGRSVAVVVVIDVKRENDVRIVRAVALDAILAGRAPGCCPDDVGWNVRRVNRSGEVGKARRIAVKDMTLANKLTRLAQIVVCTAAEVSGEVLQGQRTVESRYKNVESGTAEGTVEVIARRRGIECRKTAGRGAKYEQPICANIVGNAADAIIASAA